MISYAIEALVLAGINEMMLVTGGTHAGEFLRLLGNGHEHGIDRLSYAYQDRPGGIAEALGLAERRLRRDKEVRRVSGAVRPLGLEAIPAQVRPATRECACRACRVRWEHPTDSIL